ncbi:integrase (plasmid) [Burkholderia sp. PAMC 28687]|uniref:site-specific integrase n=1 Tax=Burkholderia sp. PAMC 28687 TaxID=1795874 RepID=UPI0007856CDC|nr:site-specific integrase [Burkholderia sp. PAMC 28687]AMM18762.1 integrase [Burkholderia sp. PAMC 28687]
MANQTQQLALPAPRTYTRTDYTALRAFVQHIAPAVIARRYYDPDDRAVSPQAATPNAMERFLRTMLDDLVQLALRHGSAVLASHLKASIKQHGSAKLTAVTLRMVEQASTLAAAVPAPDHGLGLWFRPLVTKRLAGEGIYTLGQLITYCNSHGGSWWRSVPRIGPHRARVMVAWLRRHERTLGVKVDADVDADDNGWPHAPASGLENVVIIGGTIDAPRLAPFERLAIPTALSGEHGSNRAREFAFIRAQHDLAAVHAYLNRYRDRPPTLRVYTKEIERLVLWLVVVRGVALSSMTVEDCEAYKDFLKAPVASFVGPKRSRASGRWRPFTPEGLSADSQAYAVRAIRAAFTWLTTVRYLAGNPWSAVTDPATVTKEVAVQVERALSADLWTIVRRALDQRCGDPLLNETPEQVPQWRTARAAILLMGDSGLRREEAAHARREDLRPVRNVVPVKAGKIAGKRAGKQAGEAGSADVEIWALSVVGKRRRQRTVPVSAATLRALRAHWIDRGENFDAAREDAPLIAPLVIPATLTARAKHGNEDGNRGENPAEVQSDGDDRAQAKQAYAPDALARLVRQGIKQIAGELLREGVLSHDTYAQLLETSAHAFRHTFGTRAVARDMPIDVVQRILGHASLQTTSIYVRAERQRMLDAAAQYYSEDGG